RNIRLIIHVINRQIPRVTHGMKIARRKEIGDAESSSAPWRRPHVKDRFPKALLRITMAAKAGVFQRSRGFIRSVAGALGPLVGLAQHSGFLVRDVSTALGAKAHVRLGLFIQSFAFGSIENGLANDAPGSFGPEVV